MIFTRSVYYLREVTSSSCSLAVIGLLLFLACAGPAYASPPGQEGSSSDPRIEKLLESLHHLEQAMDALDEAEDKATLNALRNALWPVLNDLGEAYRQDQQYLSAQDYHQRALDISRQVGSSRGQAASLSGLGQTFYRMTQYRQALDYLEQALPLWQGLDDQQGQAIVLSQMGHSYYQLADYQQATNYFEQAIPLWQALDEREQEADSLDAMGHSLYRLAEYEQAINIFQRALARWRQVDNTRKEASILEALGDSYTALKQYPAAVESYEQAHPIWQTLGDGAAEAGTLYRLGRTYRALGQYAAAVASLEKVIDRLDQPETKTQALIELGLVHRSTGDYRQAAAYLDRALILEPTIEDTAISARLWQESGLVLSLQGFYPAAREQFEQALSRYQALGDRRGEADIQASLGDLFSRTGDYEAATAAYQQVLELRRTEKDYPGEITALRDLGRLLRERGAYQHAMADFLLPALDAARKGDQQNYVVLLLIDVATTLGQAGDYEQALAEVDRALTLAREENDRAAEAAALQAAGQIYQAVGDSGAALPAYNQARKIFQETDDRQAAADSLAASGDIYIDLGQATEALEAYGQALNLKQDTGARPGQADILNRISQVYTRLGNETKALDYAGRAQVLWRDMGDNNGQARVLRSLSRIAAMNGRYSLAIDYAGQALAQWQQAADHDDQAAVLLDLGKLQVDLADYDQALANIQEALALYQAGGSRSGQTLSYTYLGLINRRMGRYQPAATFYQQAQAIARDTGHRQGEVTVLLQLADLAAAQADYQQARQYSDAALAIQQQAGQPAAMAGVLNYLGEIQRRLGSPQAALSLLEQALELYREADDLAGQATSRHQLGLVYLDLQQAESAGTQLQQALELRLAAGSPDRIAITLVALGHVQEQQGHPEQAIRLYQQALQVMDLLPIRTSQTEFAALPKGLEPIYRDLIRLLYEAGRYDEVYQYTEQAHLRIFLDQLNQAPAGFGPGLPVEVLDQQHILAAVQDTLLGLAHLRPSTEQRTAVDMAKLKLHENRLAYRQVLTALQQQNMYASLLLGQILPLPELQAQLDPQSTLLVYVVLSPEQALALVVTQAGLKVAPLSLSLPLLKKNVEDFYRAGMAADSDVTGNLQSLYEQLVKPLESYLQTEQLYLVPDPQLEAVPFAALHDGRRYLVERYTLALLPSSSTLGWVKLQRQPASGPPLVLGDPAGSLPLARKEAQAIAGLYQVTPFLGQEANEQVIREAGAHAPVWQLSTGAIYEPANPLLSYLNLAPASGQTDDGRLALYEIYDLALSHVNLVVLPAFTPEQNMPGAPTASLSRAYFYAGVPSVVSSLWPVQDQAAVDLKAAFHRQLLAGYCKGTALRLAQLSLLRQPATAHPYFWAGLFLAGDIGAGALFPQEPQPDRAPTPITYRPEHNWPLWGLLVLAAAGSSGTLAWLVQRRRQRQARRYALAAARQRLLAQPHSSSRTRALRYIEQELARLNRG